MPELPEVETTRQGIAPHVLGQTVAGIVVRQRQLRWPVPEDLAEKLAGQAILSVERRGKYILLIVEDGALLAHLGMSGSLRVTAADAPLKLHDHVDILFGNGVCLRYHDPRRFGCLLWAAGAPPAHPLLAGLGPEPFDARFSGEYLHTAAQGRQTPVKTFIMDSHLVVGVGNIYANEALFRARIDPRRAAGRIGLGRYETLAELIREVLQQAITQGGTTLRDFVNASGKPGYFQQTLAVYGRDGLPCVVCGEPLKTVRLAQRSTFYCPRCQH
ncbi:MAG: bifunctional DNA-formamidopyrimidine glycosylase/DNA-(apurinic or apyrimidinic site) lyase [Candidatus Methylumidiphilus sp.]